MPNTPDTTPHALATTMGNIADSLVEISETLEQLLALFQEREEGFKNRAARGGFDRKPSFRKSYDNDAGDDEGGYERKPYARKSYGDKPAYGDKKPYAKKSFGEKKSFGDKKPYAKKSFGDKKPAARAGAKKSYKGGY